MISSPGVCSEAVIIQSLLLGLGSTGRTVGEAIISTMKVITSADVTEAKQGGHVPRFCPLFSFVFSMFLLLNLPCLSLSSPQSSSLFPSTKPTDQPVVVVQQPALFRFVSSGKLCPTLFWPLFGLVRPCLFGRHSVGWPAAIRSLSGQSFRRYPDATRPLPGRCYPALSIRPLPDHRAAIVVQPPSVVVRPTMRCSGCGRCSAIPTAPSQSPPSSAATPMTMTMMVVVVMMRSVDGLGRRSRGKHAYGLDEFMNFILQFFLLWFPLEDL